MGGGIHTSLVMIIVLLLAAFTPSSSLPTASPLPREAAGALGHTCKHDQAGTRSTESIIWSCFGTIFACAWVAVHPNIPGPKEPEWVRFRRRCATMFYAIIAPEMMILWAMRQRYAAEKIKKEYNNRYHMNVTRLRGSARHELSQWIDTWFHGREEEGEQPWTLSHGFFIQMGGLLFAENGRPSFVLTFERLKELIDGNIIDPPSTTAEDILDKSKGDFLTKLFVIFQTTWFVVQCIGRWASGLSVTGLEVVTLAFAALNVIAYSLWWHKPQHVQAAILITKRSDAPPLEIHPPEVRRGWLERNAAEGDGGLEGWLPWMILVTMLLPIHIFRGIFIPLGGLATENFVESTATRVPMFYADHDITKEPKVLFPSLGISVIFGGIHLAAWTDKFPTQAEQLLWRVSALVITFGFLPVAVGVGLYNLTGRHRIGMAFRMVIEAVAVSLGSIAFIALPLYVLARLTLLILGLATLRQLDMCALLDITWSDFLPHI